VPRVGGAVVGDPTGVGELLADVAEGLAVRDGRGDRVGAGEVRAGEVRAGAGVVAVGEGLVADWFVSADWFGVGGRTRM
jgi:hypothetical protein